MACYNQMIPYLCPDLPGVQKEALSKLVRHPLMVSNVLLRNARAVQQLGVGSFYCPARLHANGWLVNGINVADYSPAWDPDQAQVIQFFGSISVPAAGLTGREANRLGWTRMLALKFEDYERELRTTLAGMLGSAGFDPAEDILAITVNRWPHGYAYEYLRLYDADWAPGEAPHEIGRQPFGHIAIANSDAGVSAYLDSAVDQAWRAVNDLTT